MTLLERDEQMREEGLKEGLARARSEAARADAAEKELMALREKYEAGEKPACGGHAG